jgi:DNA mismatch endonuclease (patch repair protein)
MEPRPHDLEPPLTQVPKPPPPSSPGATAVMKGNRGRDTRPELALRSELHGRGFRYRVNIAPDPKVRCRADIVLTRKRTAIFVDGCFWHACPQHGTRPTTNARYWAKKIARNVERDRRNDAALAAAGWQVIRVWEHESPLEAADRVEAAVGGNAIPGSGSSTSRPARRSRPESQG